MPVEALKVPRAPKRDLLGADVGRRIRTARQDRRMTLAQVGGDDLSRSFLSLVESGRSRISLRALAIVAERLEMPIGSFLADEDALREAELALDSAEIDLDAGRVREASAQLQSAESYLSRNARAHWLRGRVLAESKRSGEALGTFRDALALAERRDDSILVASILWSLGNLLFEQGSLDEALVQLRRGLQLVSRDAGSSALQARFNISLGHVAHAQGKVDAARTHYAKAESLFGSIYDPGHAAAFLLALGNDRRKKDDLQGAVHYSKQGLGIARLTAQWRDAARELNAIASRYREAGNLDEAARLAGEAIARAREAGATDVEAFAHGTMAAIYLQRNDFEKASAEADQAESLSTEGVSLPAIDAWIVQATIAHRNRDTAKVDALYERALSGLKSLGNQVRYADTALGFSRLLKERGDTDRALEVALNAAEAAATRTA